MGKTIEDVKPLENDWWLSRAINFVRPILGLGNEPDPGGKNAEKFKLAFEPKAAILKTSLEYTKGLKNVDSKLRKAESAAAIARDNASDAAEKAKWSQTDQLLGKFNTSLTVLDQAYGTGCSELGGRLERRKVKLTYLKQSLEATSLDATAVTTALGEIDTAVTEAKPPRLNDASFAMLQTATIAADAAAVDAAKALKGKNNDALITGIEALRSKVVTEIAKITAPAEKKKVQDLLDEWAKTRQLALTETDPTKKKAKLTECQKTIGELLVKAGEAAGSDVNALKQEAYKKALEDQFGLTIQMPTSTTGTPHKNTHFDMFYDMMSLLPIEHTKQDSLKILKYYETGTGAAFNSGSKAVTMGDISQSLEAPYYDPVTGEQHKQNWFKISTLHEVGHSVDDKFGIMSTANMAKDAYGGWRVETVATMLPIFARHFLGAAGRGTTIHADTLNDLIQTALDSGTAIAPPEPAPVTPPVAEAGKINAADWLKLKPFLDKCISIRDGQKAWQDGDRLVIDSRSYHQAYASKWVSYSTTARSANFAVRSYQWRAPGEWFAEIYAYSWMMKKKPPSLDSAAMKYMYSPKT